MSYPFASAALPDATRIAQTVVHRDVQAQVLVTAQTRRHVAESRRIPEAARGAGTSRHGERPRAARDPQPPPDDGNGRRLDLRA